MKKSLSTAMLVAALALTSACGGGDDRPSKAEVKKSITSKDSVFGTSIPESAADCVSGVLVDSKLSDKTLNAIVEGDKDYKGPKKDQKALMDLTSKFSKCVAS
ncbi:hypothetical protein [Aeromicrobium chenweiae]|uniref:Uncharacterized protein n=1 Tax=Aeromicrobium chenweiae TaxID=2079793 RepID=A0A2S0WNI6_9ACTN|nr:hypothetical protein [Aeromicrobium chenweiae]AWB92862.1 hypothetical protein C3E78_11970 [Aeromicrobium chenweiae]TGN33857.1 hypothetical protein E4L97_02020 [Aeromicrobium chenweiae]